MSDSKLGAASYTGTPGTEGIVKKGIKRGYSDAMDAIHDDRFLLHSQGPKEIGITILKAPIDGRENDPILSIVPQRGEHVVELRGMDKKIAGKEIDSSLKVDASSSSIYSSFGPSIPLLIQQFNYLAIQGFNDAVKYLTSMCGNELKWEGRLGTSVHHGTVEKKVAHLLKNRYAYHYVSSNGERTHSAALDLEYRRPKSGTTKMGKCTNFQDVYQHGLCFLDPRIMANHLLYQGICFGTTEQSAYGECVVGVLKHGRIPAYNLSPDCQDIGTKRYMWLYQKSHSYPMYIEERDITDTPIPVKGEIWQPLGFSGQVLTSHDSINRTMIVKGQDFKKRQAKVLQYRDFTKTVNPENALLKSWKCEKDFQYCLTAARSQMHLTTFIDRDTDEEIMKSLPLTYVVE